MTDDEIRARALDAAVRIRPVILHDGIATPSALDAGLALQIADLLATYIRLGMEAVEGMLRPPVA